MTDDELPFHPYADIFPLMEKAEYQALHEDIQIHGLRNPIVTFEGKILDGRNRYRACRELRVEVQTVPYEDGDPLSFVISANVRRRHLTTSQRAMAAAKLANLPPHRPRRPDKEADLPTSAPPVQVSQAEAAELMRVSERSVKSAKVVRDQAIPELIARVETGDIPVSVAARIARSSIDEQQKLVEETERTLADAQSRSGRHRQPREVKEYEDAGVENSKTPTFRTILIDPAGGDSLTEAAAGARLYPEPAPAPELPDLRTLDLKRIAGRDCVLICWTTQRSLPQALSLLRVWGFTYERVVVFRANRGSEDFKPTPPICEFVIQAVRGNPELPFGSDSPCCFDGEWLGPGDRCREFYELIRNATRGPRVEICGRVPHEGFERLENAPGPRIPKDDRGTKGS